MRLISWNCNNGINKKEQIEYFQSFNCDVAVLPELKEHNIEVLQPSSSLWVTNNHLRSKPKGLGILCFNGFQIQELPRDEDMEIYIPVKIKGKGIEFNLLAIWNFYWACKQGRFKGLKGDDCLEWSALKHYKPILEDPCICMGDFNFGPTFSQEAFVHMNNVFEDMGIKGLYHQFNKLPWTETKHYTYQSPMKTFHHLDHIFGSEYFQKHMKAFKIGNLEDAILSDHAPLILDI